MAILKNEKLEQELEEVQNFFNANNSYEAFKKIDKIIKHSHGHYLSYNYRGILFLNLKQYDRAIQDFKKSLTINQYFAEGHCNLGNVYLTLGSYQNALKCYKEACFLDKNFLQVRINLGTLYFKLGDYRLAIDSYQYVIARNPKIEFVHQQIAEVYNSECKHSLAISHHQRALEINPKNPLNHFLLGRDFLWAGENKMAEEYFKKTIEINPKFYPAYYALTKLKKIKPGDAIVSKIAGLLTEVSITKQDCIYLQFSLANIYEGAKNYESFFSVLREGCKIKKELSQFNLKKTTFSYEKLMNRYSNQVKNINLKIDYSEEKNICPIFILGMPRSGTSLVEQILSNNNLIFGAGELSTIYESLLIFADQEKIDSQSIEKSLLKIRKSYLDRLGYITDKLFVIDKLPLNFLCIGYIKKIFPNAKIIHTTRDPIATCFSIYKTLFTEGSLEFSYDEDDIINFYKLYQSVMDFWKKEFSSEIFEVSYEILTSNPEKISKDIFDFIGIEYESKYINIKNNLRPVMTASDLQVRENIYTGSSDVWKKYTPFLQKFINVFGN